MFRPVVFTIWLALSAFGCDGAETAPSTATGEVIPKDPPKAPAESDPAFAITGARRWYLIADGHTAGQDSFDVAVVAPAGVARIDGWVDGAYAGALTRSGDAFQGSLDVSALASGEHEVLLSADAKPEAFARLAFTRSHAMYVVVSTDWDDPDNANFRLVLQEELHAWHPELVISHLVGPYTFTDPSVSADRRAFLVSWLLGMRDGFGDEIGLHIHPYCSFVETTAVPCNHEPSISMPGPDTTGYTVTNESYTEEELETLLLAADALFQENGLPKPTAYRAGAWTLVPHNMRALASAGYVVDSSAANWARLEEWEGLAGTTLFEWNKAHWGPIDDTSQPYYPSADDLAVAGDPSIAVLELPDNGALVDYVTGEEMIEIFGKNWQGGPLEEPRVLSIGWHPPNFSPQYQDRMHVMFTHADQFLAATDGGPVVYATMSAMAKVWPPP